MKRASIFLILLAFLFPAPRGYSQIVNKATKKKISIGIGLFSDVILKMPEGLKSRAINQGMNLFALYNVPFGKSDFGLSIGLGLSIHSLYGNFLVNSTPDTTTFIKIPDSISYKKSRMTLAYLELPIEFRFKSKSKVGVGIGFKAGLMISSSAKYVGNGKIYTDNFIIPTTEKTRIKYWGIKNLEQFAYGPTIRVGYKWFNVYAYYMLSDMFSKSRGPEVVPLNVGFVLMPF